MEEESQALNQQGSPTGHAGAQVLWGATWVMPPKWTAWQLDAGEEGLILGHLGSPKGAVQSHGWRATETTEDFPSPCPLRTVTDRPGQIMPRSFLLPELATRSWLSAVSHLILTLHSRCPRGGQSERRMLGPDDLQAPVSVYRT